MQRFPQISQRKHQHLRENRFLRTKSCFPPPPGQLSSGGAFTECSWEMNAARSRARGPLSLVAQLLSTASPRFLAPHPASEITFPPRSCAPSCDYVSARRPGWQAFPPKSRFTLLSSLASDGDGAAPTLEPRNPVGAPILTLVPPCVVKGPVCPLSSSGGKRQKAVLAGQY